MADIYTNRNNEEHTKEVNEYYEEIALLALLFLRGQITRAEYTSQHILLTEQSLINGVLLAGGVLTAQATIDLLTEQQNITRESTRGLANDIEAGKYSENETRNESTAKEMLQNRLALWTFTLAGAYNVGVRTAAQEQFISLPDTDEIVSATSLHIWELGATEKHCKDCYKASQEPPQPMSFWDNLANSGIYPQSHSLECTGFYCDCGYKEVGYMLPDGTQVLL